MKNARSLAYLVSAVTAAGGVALAQFAPVVSDFAPMFLLGVSLVLALVLRPAPALLGAVIGALGLAIVRPAAFSVLDLFRGAFFLVLVGAVVAMMHGRRRAIEATAQYKHLFEQNPLPMWYYDDDTLAFLAVNQAAIDKYGYSREEFSRMTLRDVRPEAELPALAARPAKGLPQYSGRWRHHAKDGRVIEVLVRSNLVVSGGVRARLALLEDLTDRHNLEAQLRQAQKMDAVGQLAGGVAHDFNNLLTAILGYCELLMESIAADDARRADVAEIQRAGIAAASLTSQLLAFSRKQVIEPTVLDFNTVVAETGRLLKRVIGEDVQLELKLNPALGRVKADGGQMGQVLMNLAVNARDAMPRGGKLTIETENVTLDEAYAGTHLSVVPGPHVMLAVSDTGTGMSPEVQARLFEPFFTTKEQGKGTGLGLASVYGIVKQSGGSIWVYSEIGHGTTFKVYLPAVEVEEVQVRPRVAPVAAALPATILIVEDNPPLEVIARRVLQRSGYTVLSATSADEAVRTSRAHVGPIHLLLSDVVMPGQSGPALAAQLTAERPGMRVLHMSGYTDDAIVRHGTIAGTTAFLQKPFTPAGLCRKVREILRTESSAT
jgi:PAS domain S-box-containing protein